MNDDTHGSEPTRRQWIGYWNMIVQQTQNAFNDKMAQFILIPLGGAVGLSIESAAGLLIALPFVIFAPLAGWLSDRFSKRDVLVRSAILQLFVLLGICGAILLKNLHLALCGFFALAIQAAFFSPAKLGINKELVGSKHLGFATGIQQMTAMLAMLVGQIVAAWLFDHRNHALGGTPETAWRAAFGPLWVITLFSVPTIFLAWTIPRVPAQGGGKFTWKLSYSHFLNLADLWRDGPLRRASFGVAFFWGFAAYINLWSVKLAKVMTHGGDGFGTISALFMVSASLGMTVGFGLASFLLRKKIELGWVPLAGIVMTLLSIALAIVPPGTAPDYLQWSLADPLAIARYAPSSAFFLLLIALLALSSALFLAPLNAWMQDHYPSAKRGELQSAVNLQDCLAGAITVGIITGFEMAAIALGIDAKHGLQLQMIFVSIAAFFATSMVIRLLPADLIRLLGTSLVRVIYHIRAVNSHRIPTNGGVLLLPNHVTFADSFYLATACPRPIRFVMDETFMTKRSIRIFTGIFDTMTIRRDHPLEAIREIIHALKQGDVICLFPEGQLTRTGTLCTLQRGFELIARKSAHPLIPVWCDGAWGSIFSFERNRFFGKIPHRLDHGLTVAFGKAMDPADANVENVRNGILAASTEAISHQFASRKWLQRMPKSADLACESFRALDENTRLRMWSNGHQIGMVNALHRRNVFHVLQDDPEITKLLGLTAAFPELFRATMCLHDSFDGQHGGVWVGGDHLRNVLQTTQITSSHIVFYDFGSRALKPVERAGVCHCACLALDRVVIAMSMPHPPPSPDDSFPPQNGHKLHSWGKLLPGWHLIYQDDGEVKAHGPAAPTDGILLPAGCTLDDEGFLISQREHVGRLVR